ncbi:hypothetical protein [Flavobacterium terrae]|uniref:Uncharacterized protein n=1 Tax=Flavobacterium terrae TaxID=415425 RepID=A0A1M6D7J5_9FLAO|nr:hypothetical protein [Flavobacterium terrae]SHI69206.1 hypothetical protein SAMN05444363_1292 [Flavobacterium terrae]
MKYYIALYQKLKDTYLSINSNENDLPLICPSLTMYSKEELELLKPQSQITDKNIIGESLLKKEQVSNELNSIPTSSSNWSVNPQNILSEVYKNILENIQPIGLQDEFVKLDVNDSAVLFDSKQKPTKEYKAYLKHLELYEKSLDTIQEHLLEFGSLSTDSEKTSWEEKLVVLKSKAKLAYAELEVKGYKNVVEKAINDINNNTELEKYLSLLESTKSIFDITKKTGVETLASYHNIDFSPYDFMVNESGWNNLKIDKKELDELYLKAKQSSVGIPEEILSLEYDEKYIKGIELDYSFVHLKRSWFNKEIFNEKFFSHTNEKKISDGQTISNDFQLSAFPKIMILMKNLKVDLETNIENQVIAINNMIHFGPLVLKNQMFVNRQNNTNFLKVVTNKETIRSNQLQYLTRKSENTSLEIQKTETKETTITNPVIRRTSAINTASMRILNSPKTNIIKPVEAKPVAARPIGTILHVNTTLLTPIIATFPIVGANTTFIVNDSVSKSGVYKCSISIKGKEGNNIVREIETNQEGKITTHLPVGKYNIDLKCDFYTSKTIEINIENNNPINLNYELSRDIVEYKSYFLIGMICEKMPLIN